MSNTINPNLCVALSRFCDDVRVVDAGVPLSGYYSTDPATGRTKMTILSRGESYQTNCPFCGDERRRMSVNHRFGVYDPDTRDYGIGLWKCYNEECQSHLDRRKELFDRVSLPGIDLPKPKGRIRVLPARHLTPVEFPGSLIPVSHLDMDHPITGYLIGRDFDPVELSDLWRVGFAEYVPPRTRGCMAQGRIIAPVTVDGIEIGWQARYPDELNWKEAGIAKYLTYFPKSLAVYGLGTAVTSPFIVLMEGVTDVWRYGPGGVSCLGRDASPRQIELLAKALNGRPFVIVPDMDDPLSLPEFKETATKVLKAGHTGPVCLAVLPPDTDPADLARHELHRLVDEAVADPIWAAPTR